MFKKMFVKGIQRKINAIQVSGMLVFAFSLAAVFMGDETSLRQGFIVAAALFALISMILSMIIAANTRKSLDSLTRAATQLAEGNLTSVIGEPVDDQFYELYGALNNIRDQLKASYGAIQEYIDELQSRVKELTLLNDIDGAILAGSSLDTLLELAGERICGLLGGDFSLVALVDKKTETMKIKSTSGFTDEEKRGLLIRMRDKIINCDLCLSLIAGQVTVVENLYRSHLSEDAKSVCSCFGAKAMLAAPLIVDGKPIGSIVVWYRQTRSFDESMLDRFKLFTDQTAVAIKSASLVDGMRGLTVEIMRALAMAIDARDSYTANHSDRVSRFAVALAQELGLGADVVQAIEYAGLLHDIGKIGIAENILNKTSSLTSDEMSVMKTHSVMSADIIRPIEFLADVVPIVRHHHEWFNGKGYPSGLAGEEIPLGARILAIADALEAITSDRPYSKSLTLHEGLARLKAGAHVQFDPEMVEAMSRIIGLVEEANRAEVSEFDGDMLSDGVMDSEAGVEIEIEEAG
ncbi:MAG: HD domain-containing protein [Actinomycetota bacterium]|nr:HD domain-containing protein [Actinomycetota bacterium]